MSHEGVVNTHPAVNLLVLLVKLVLFEDVALHLWIQVAVKEARDGIGYTTFVRKLQQLRRAKHHDSTTPHVDRATHGDTVTLRAS